MRPARTKPISFLSYQGLFLVRLISYLRENLTYQTTSFLMGAQIIKTITTLSA